MFSIIFSSSRKSVSSPHGEGKPRTLGEAMNCCKTHTGWRPQRSWWQSASGCVGSGTLLVLLPKCPVCIAAYLALWTGAGAAMPVATHLRPMLAISFFATALLLLVRCVAARI
jgi:hypothetical protein